MEDRQRRQEIGAAEEASKLMQKEAKAQNKVIQEPKKPGGEIWRFWKERDVKDGNIHERWRCKEIKVTMNSSAT